MPINKLLLWLKIYHLKSYFNFLVLTFDFPLGRVTTGERIGYERGKEEGKQEGELAVILKQLKRRVGELSPEIQQRIQSLSGNQLETLGEALLDFTNMSDLLNWLQTN